jgi:hypothetical protein
VAEARSLFSEVIKRVRTPGTVVLEICRVSAIVQVVAVEHVVGRATPLRRIAEPVPALPGTKFNPCTDTGKPSIAPAIALDGRITSMVGPDVMAIVADADFVLSASLVATIEMAFGDGATVGAVKRPLASRSRRLRHRSLDR